MKGTEQAHPERMRARAGEPEPVGGIGPCREQLGPEIAEAWDYIVGCAAPGVLTSMDRIAVQLAAALLARFWLAPIAVDPKDVARLHALLGSMGMTPADRSKVVVPKAPAAGNKFNRFRVVK
jgi:hypothetical protein